MKKALAATLFALGFALLFVAKTFATDATLLPNAKQIFLDANGNPLSAGKVYFYVPNTTTPKTTWQDAGKTITNTNPVTLDAAGRAVIFGDGTYRQLVKDSAGNTIWDALTASTGSGGGSAPSTVGDGDLVGTVKPWAGLIAPNQYAFAYGQTVSRATYSDLFTALTIRTNAVCVASSNVISGISDTAQIPIGAKIEADCVAPSTVTAKTSSTITLDHTAASTGAVIIRILPFGNGDGATTFNLPDLRGRTVAGRDNMGGTDSGRLTNAGFAIAGLGAAGGLQQFALNNVNLPPYTPSGTISITDPGHAHNFDYNINAQYNAGGGATSTIGSGGAHTATFSATTGITAAFTGAPQGGSATPFSIVQPTIELNYIIKITPDTSSSVATGVASLGGMTGVIACGSGLLCTGNVIDVSLSLNAGNHSVVVGTGVPGVFTSAGPGSAGQCLTAAGASSDPSFQPCVSSITAFGAVSGDASKGAVNAAAFVAALTATGEAYCPDNATFYVDAFTVPDGSRRIYGSCNIIVSGTAPPTFRPIIYVNAAGTPLTIRDLRIVAGVDYKDNQIIMVDQTLAPVSIENIATSGGTNGVTFFRQGNSGRLVNSTIADTDSYGVYITGTAARIDVSNNLIYNAGSHALAIDTCAQCTANGNRIWLPGDGGIWVTHSEALAITGNVTETSRLEGIHIDSSTNWTVTGNTVNGTVTDYCMSFSDDYGSIYDGVISGNSLRDCASSGITIAAISPNEAFRINVVGNHIHNPNQSGSLTQKYGISFQFNVQYSLVANNLITADNGKMEYAINEIGGATNNSFVGNTGTPGTIAFYDLQGTPNTLANDFTGDVSGTAAAKFQSYYLQGSRALDRETGTVALFSPNGSFPFIQGDNSNTYYRAGSHQFKTRDNATFLTTIDADGLQTFDGLIRSNAIGQTWDPGAGTYTGGIANSRFVGMLGAAATPDNTLGATAVFQKFANVLGSPSAAATAAYIQLNQYNTTNGGSGLLVEGLDFMSTTGAGFIEGIRSHAVTSRANGSAMGAVTAGFAYGPSYTYVFGIEAEAQNNTGTDAPHDTNLARVLASFNASCGGTYSCDVAYFANPFSSKHFRVGFYVPTVSVDVAAFKSDATAEFGLDLSGGTFSTAAIAAVGFTLGGATGAGHVSLAASSGYESARVASGSNLIDLFANSTTGEVGLLATGAQAISLLTSGGSAALDASGNLAVSGAVTPGSPIALAKGGTGADLSATGGASQVLRQSSAGAVVTVSQLACADLSDASSGCSAASGITALTGDVTATGPGSVAATLATVNSNVGPFGSSTSIPTFTVNAKGLITAASGNAVIAPAGTLTGATLASNVLASSLTSVGTLTGGATGAGFTLALGTSTLTGRLPFANLAQGATNTVLANATNATADFAAFSMPSCSTAGSALNWTTDTGFGCNTSITAAAVPVGGITGMGTGVATWLATPSSANLAAALTDEIGSGSAVFGSAGSWTPALKFGGATTGITYSGQGGTYQTIGGYTTIYLTIALTSKGSATGVVTIEDLPAAVTAPGATGICQIDDGSGLGGTVLVAPVSGTSYVYLAVQGAASRAFLNDANFTNTTVAYCQATYKS